MTKRRPKQSNISQFSTKREKSHTEPRYLTAEEIEKLLSSIEDMEDFTLIQFALETGVRRSELTTIETKDIDFEQQSAPIYDEKKDEYRRIVFPKQVAAQVKRYLNARQVRSKLLFPFTIRTVNNKVKRWATKAGVRLDPKTKESKVSAHWFRHTYIRRSQMAGRDMKVVQQNTGDTEQTILKYYRELTIEDRVKETEEKPLVGF